jgi:hypothetical protein
MTEKCATMNMMILMTLKVKFHSELFVMITHIDHGRLTKVKPKQLKQIVKNGRLFMFIIVVMVSGIA